MRRWRWAVAGSGFVWALVACAKLAGLESSDPTDNPTLPSGSRDGGKGDGGSYAVNSAGAKISPLRVSVTTSCKVTASTQYIRIQNESDHAIPWEIRSPNPSVIQLRDDNDAGADVVSGSLAAKDYRLVYTTVTPSMAGQASTELIVKTGDETQVVPVDIIVNGGSLALSTSVVDFGQVRKDTAPPPQTIEVENTGNVSVTITSWVGDSPEFSVGNGSMRIDPGKKVAAPVNFQAGGESPLITGIFSPQTQAPTCSDAPQLTLKGERVNQEVTVGPGGVDFGAQACNRASATTRTIDVTNYSNQEAEFQVTLPAGAASWFTLDTTGGTAPKAAGGAPGVAHITVGLKPVAGQPGPQHLEAIQVQITDPSPAKATRTVNAAAQAVGAFIDVSPVTLNYTAAGTKTFKVSNTGNALIFLRHESSSTSFTFDGDTDHTSLYPPGNFFPSSANVTVRIAAPGQHSADITTAREPPPIFFESAALCNAPAVVHATANF